MLLLLTAFFLHYNSEYFHNHCSTLDILIQIKALNIFDTCYKVIVNKTYVDDFSFNNK